MALEDDMALLGGVPLFRLLDRDGLRLIAFSAKRRGLKAGDLLFRRGAPTTGGAIVAKGVIALSPASDGSTYLAGPGTLIGELALVIETKHPANAHAVEASEALLVPRSLFRRVITEYPGSAVGIRGALAARMKAHVSELQRARALLLSIG